jgi:AraC-like DNA-binding protein
VRLDVQFQIANSQQAFRAWREQVHGVFGGLEIEPQSSPERFWAHLVVDQAPGLRLGDIDAAAQTVLRPEGLARRSNSDELGLLVQLAGTARVDHGDAHTTLLPGEALLLDNTRRYRLDMPDRFRQTVLLVKRDCWSSRLPELEGHVGHRVPASASGRLLLAFARALMDESGQFDADQLSQAAVPLMDLVCAAYVDGNSKEAESKSVAALRQRILQDIRERLSSVALSPMDLAERHGISVRYLHRLFQLRGQTVMAHVAAQRMALCQRLLVGRRAKPWRARDLALACGYADDSTFRRAFRLHFGCSVTDYARSLREPLDAS